MLRLAGEAGAKHRVLRRDADRAGVEVAFAHHDAARRDQLRRREAELVRAEKPGHPHVPPGAKTPLGLPRDAPAHVVEPHSRTRITHPPYPPQSEERMGG